MSITLSQFNMLFQQKEERAMDFLSMQVSQVSYEAKASGHTQEKYLSIGDLVIEDTLTPNDKYRHIISAMHKEHHFIHVRFYQEEIAENLKVSLKVQVQPIQVTIYSDMITRFMACCQLDTNTR